MFDQFTSSPSLWFTIPALVGTIFFIIRLGMALIGIDFVEGADGDGGFDADFGDDMIDVNSVDEGVDHAESSSVFKFISIQTITAFAMGFGWGGLIGLHTLSLEIVPSFVIGLATGLAFSWFIVWLFKLMYAMESSGNISIKDAYACEGVATSSVPGNNTGTGRVRITLRENQRAYAARTPGEPIKMGTPIRVTGVNQDNTLTVEAR